MLGTIVDIGVRAGGSTASPIHAAFAEIDALQRCLSRFDPASDIARFNALPAGASFVPVAATLEVLRAAQALSAATAGLFDISCGTAPDGWACRDGRLHKLHARTRLDLGGIGKGYVVDRAVQRMIDHGAAAGWVNAGGDLRVFGDIELPVSVRDESNGGVRPFADLTDGAFATSHYGGAHVSVAAPLCLWADALTKVVALSGDASHPLLARHGALAWLH
jgi:thiamine biosynthesis lipoprotein